MNFTHKKPTNNFEIIEEVDGSYTINLNGGEITIGENHDKERQEFIETDD
jgi:hypothetical protein